MTSAEIAAYIGAAAWLPHIGSLIYRKVVKPTVTIVPDKYAGVGFTSYGPIFNVRMMFSAENKDLIIDGFELLLVHSEGEKRTLRWSGLSETFSEITDTSGNRQVVSRDQTPIALKIGIESLLEKFVRFQEPRFHEIDRPYMSDLLAHFNFLKRSSPEPADYVAQTLTSKELFKVLDARKKHFWWKPGRYQIKLKLSSPKKFKLAHSDFHLDLTAVDVDRLKQNADTIEIDLRNVISSNLPDAKAQPLNYNWTNVSLYKTEVK